MLLFETHVASRRNKNSATKTAQKISRTGWSTPPRHAPPSAGDFYINGTPQPSRYSAVCTLQALCLNCGDRNGVDDVLNGGTAR